MIFIISFFLYIIFVFNFNLISDSTQDLYAYNKKINKDGSKVIKFLDSGSEGFLIHSPAHGVPPPIGTLNRNRYLVERNVWEKITVIFFHFIRSILFSISLKFEYLFFYISFYYHDLFSFPFFLSPFSYFLSFSLSIIFRRRLLQWIAVKEKFKDFDNVRINIIHFADFDS